MLQAKPHSGELAAEVLVGADHLEDENGSYVVELNQGQMVI